MNKRKKTNRLLKLMEEKGVDINDVAASTHIQINRLKEYLAGSFDNITVSETAVLSEYFNISPSYLMGWIDYRALKYKIDSRSFIYENTAREMPTNSSSTILSIMNYFPLKK